MSESAVETSVARDAGAEGDAGLAGLIGLLRAGRHYDVVTRAERMLADAPGDSAVREVCALTYCRLGLVSAARRLLESAECGDEVRRSVASSLPARDTRISWGVLEGQFRRNLALFDAKTAAGGTSAGLGSAVEEVLRACRPKLDLLKTADGCPQVYSRLEGARGWLPALAPHSSIRADKYADDWRGKLLTTLAINGIGLGFGVRAIYEASARTFLDFCAPLIIVEPSLLAWAVVLHLHDWSDILADERVAVCAGAGALAAFEREIQNADHSPPAVARYSTAWPAWDAGQAAEAIDDAALMDRIRPEVERRERLQSAAYERACAAVAGRDEAWWERRFARAGREGPPLKVLAVTTRYSTVLQYSARDALAALERLGCATHTYIEPNAHSQFSRAKLAEMVAETKPDLILLLDHLRAEYQGIFPENIPGVSWVQDALPNLCDAAAGPRVLPLEFVIGLSAGDLIARYGYPAQRVYPCSIPTNAAALGELGSAAGCREQAADLAPYACDVMYATHAPAHVRIESRFDEECRDIDAPTRRLAEAGFEEIRSALARPRLAVEFDCDELVDRLERRFSARCRDAVVRGRFVALFRGMLDQELRLRAIRAAAEWADETGGRFHLYGNGWERFPDLARFARGPVKHGAELGRAFRAAKVSLHAGCNYSFHQRVLDGLCAGGFVLMPRRLSEQYVDVYAAMYERWKSRGAESECAVKPGDLPAAVYARMTELLEAFGLPVEEGLRLTPVWGVAFKMLFGQRSARFAGELWPAYGEVTYASVAELKERIGHFVREDGQRRRIAQEMRGAVLEHFTYDALMRRVLEFVRAYLRGERTSLAP